MKKRRSTDAHERRHMRCMGGGVSEASSAPKESPKKANASREGAACLGASATRGSALTASARVPRQPRQRCSASQWHQCQHSMGFSTGLHALCQAPHPCASYGTPASKRHVVARTCHTAGWSLWNPYAHTDDGLFVNAKAFPVSRSSFTPTTSCKTSAFEKTALTTRSSNVTAHSVGRAQSKPVLSQI